MSAKKPRMLWIPQGFAHGFLSLENQTEVLYKTTDFYYPEYEGGLRWNDPALNIDWPLKKYGITEPILSNKDGNFPSLHDFHSPFEFKGE
jgi:dTDP-4-dehydrorhamnose 3,5-epimerase